MLSSWLPFTMVDIVVCAADKLACDVCTMLACAPLSASRFFSLACCLAVVGCADSWLISPGERGEALLGLTDLLADLGREEFLLVLHVVSPELEKGFTTADVRATAALLDGAETAMVSTWSVTTVTVIAAWKLGTV